MDAPYCLGPIAFTSRSNADLCSAPEMASLMLVICLAKLKKDIMQRRTSSGRMTYSLM